MEVKSQSRRSISKDKPYKQESNESMENTSQSDISGENSKKYSDEYKIVLVTNHDNQVSHAHLTRKEIIEKRIERKKAKQAENKRIREQKLLVEKIYKRSEKIQIITSKANQKYKNLLETPTKSNQKFKKYNNTDFNLLDFIIEKSKNKRPLKQMKKITKKTIKLNKGKRRENKIKRSYSRLKKIILKNRKAKIVTTVHAVDPVESLKTFEKLNLNEEKSLTIHSRKFRPYCDNLTSKNLCNLTEKILRELFRFQKRAYEKNEIKARAHRRFIMGFKETKGQLDINKLKFIVIAPDCEACDLPGGIDETISTIKSKCKENNIPYLFSLRRRQLGYVLYKKVPVNCVGVISYDGVQDIFYELIQCLKEDREHYLKTINCQQAG